MRTLLVVGVLSSVFFSIPNASGDPLTLKEVLSSVQERFPVLLAALQEKQSAAGELLAAQGSFDPSIKIDGIAEPKGYYDGRRVSVTYDNPLELQGARLFSSYAVSRGDFPVYDEKYLTNSGGELRTGVEIPLLRDGSTDRRRTGINRAEEGVNIAEANITQRKIEVTRAATFVYFDWVAAGARRKIYKDLLDTAVQRTNQLQSRVSSGDIPKFDLIDNNRLELQRRAQVVAAERFFQQASFELSLYRRDNEGNPIFPRQDELPSGFPEPSLDDYVQDPALETAHQRRPELKRIQAQQKQNDLELRLQKNQLLPRLDLQVAASKDLGSGGKNREPTELDAGVKVEIPLRLRAPRGRIQVAEAKGRELTFLEQLQKDRISNEVRDAAVALELSRKRILLARDELEAAQSLAEGERTRLALGDSNLIFVNLREQTVAEAAIREVDALLDYQRALGLYRAALGNSFESS